LAGTGLREESPDVPRPGQPPYDAIPKRNSSLLEERREEEEEEEEEEE